MAALGRPGTGKSHKLWAEYTSRAPRVLSFGVLRQDLARDPNVVVALGLPQLKDVLRRIARGRYDRWHVATALNPAELAELFALLVPPNGVGNSLAEKMGGMAIEACEAYEVFPNGRTPAEMLAAIRQARHYALDMYLAAQRPASCARDVTAAADHVYLFAQSEPADLDFIARTCSKSVARAVANLAAESHECIYLNRPRNEIRHLDAHGRTLASIDPMAGSRW